MIKVNTDENNCSVVIENKNSISSIQNEITVTFTAIMLTIHKHMEENQIPPELIEADISTMLLSSSNMYHQEIAKKTLDALSSELNTDSNSEEEILTQEDDD